MGKCSFCGDTGKVLERPDRLMGATYPFDDRWKGDEHVEPCPICNRKETMDWKETVLHEDELIVAYENNNPADDHAIGCKEVAKSQAQISFPLGEQAGIEKVVKEVEKRARAGELSWCGYECIDNWQWWQAFKQENIKP